MAGVVLHGFLTLLLLGVLVLVRRVVAVPPQIFLLGVCRVRVLPVKGKIVAAGIRRGVRRLWAAAGVAALEQLVATVRTLLAVTVVWGGLLTFCLRLTQRRQPLGKFLGLTFIFLVAVVGHGKLEALVLAVLVAVRLARLRAGQQVRRAQIVGVPLAGQITGRQVPAVLVL